MAKKPAFNYVNFTIWMILILIICVGLLILYNKTVFEKFEEPAEEAPPPKKKATEEEAPPTEEAGEATAATELDSKEQSLFDKIVKNEVSTADLEKLINAGVVTQNMVEKFLSKLDQKEDSKIEAFCTGGIGSPGCAL